VCAEVERYGSMHAHVKKKNRVAPDARPQAGGWLAVLPPPAAATQPLPVMHIYICIYSSLRPLTLVA